MTVLLFYFDADRNNAGPSEFLYEIEDRMLARGNDFDETGEQYASRLRRTALSLPASLINSCLDKIKANIEATVESKGSTTKSLLD